MTQLFLTTHWTRVLAARGESPEARQALCDLCEAYYGPVLVFLRQSRRDDDGAREAAHAFFADLLERHGIAGADPGQGRFRTYLLGALKNFLGRQRAAAERQKRGGHVVHEPLDYSAETSAGREIADPSTLPSDSAFDREWALHLLDRALNVMASEAAERGQPAQFEMLKPWLTGAAGETSQAQVARRLGLSDGALRVAIHRLRRRFREVVKAEIAQTVNDPRDVDEELRHLIAVLS